VQDFIWDRMAERGIDRQDRSTWTQPSCHIKENYSDPVFQACATERLKCAVEDLLGPGRWRERDHAGHWGWWPVNFSKGADQPWTVPTSGWHWDGTHFRHFVDAPVQGLLLLCMFSDIGTRGGGTLVAEGSHRIVARFLNERPEGLELLEAIPLCNRSHPWLAELTGSVADQSPTQDIYEEKPAVATTDPETSAADRIERFINTATPDVDGAPLQVSEITAAPGDVFLCHPFLYHSASQNHSGIPRFMCNRTTPLFEKMNFHRPDGDYSPVETSIHEALHLS
jgi:ectoine hydroxylase-related dioxygenase (phytanoyl-CoA dioxygenase family)